MTNSKLIVLLAGTALLAAGSAATAQPGGRDHGERGERGDHGGRHVAMMLRAADANGDRAITRAEVDSLQAEMFTWMDRNGDGYLDEADQSPVRRRLAALGEDGDGPDGPGGRMRGRGGEDGPPHMRADADDDGRISRAEFLGSERPLFDAIDSDGNGTLSTAELDAARERRQDHGPRRRD